MFLTSFPKDHRMSISWQVKQIMYVVSTFRTSKGPPKFCIDLEADWLLILDEVGGESPGYPIRVSVPPPGHSHTFVRNYKGFTAPFTDSLPCRAKKVIHASWSSPNLVRSLQEVWHSTTKAQGLTSLKKVRADFKNRRASQVFVPKTVPWAVG